MLDQVLKIFEITPNYDLNIMKQGQDLYDVTARVLTGMRDVFKMYAFPSIRYSLGWKHSHLEKDGVRLTTFSSLNPCNILSSSI